MSNVKSLYWFWHKLFCLTSCNELLFYIYKNENVIKTITVLEIKKYMYIHVYTKNEDNLCCVLLHLICWQSPVWTAQFVQVPEQLTDHNSHLVPWLGGFKFSI